MFIQFGIYLWRKFIYDPPRLKRGSVIDNCGIDFIKHFRGLLHIEQVKATPDHEAITVVGHTDAKGSEEYNYALGQRRADTMRDYMVSKGIAPSDITTSSRGKLDMLPDYDIYSVQQRRSTIRTTIVQ